MHEIITAAITAITIIWPIAIVFNYGTILAYMRREPIMHHRTCPNFFENKFKRKQVITALLQSLPGPIVIWFILNECSYGYKLTPIERDTPGNIWFKREESEKNRIHSVKTYKSKHGGRCKSLWGD